MIHKRYSQTDMDMMRASIMNVIKKPFQAFNRMGAYKELIHQFDLSIWRLKCGLILHIILAIFLFIGIFSHNEMIIVSGIFGLLINLFWLTLEGQR